MAYKKSPESHLLTSILLAVASVMIAIIGWFCVDKLGSIDLKQDKAFTAIGGMRMSFDDYKVVSEGRFTKIETQLDLIGNKRR